MIITAPMIVTKKAEIYALVDIVRHTVKNAVNARTAPIAAAPWRVVSLAYKNGFHTAINRSNESKMVKLISRLIEQSRISTTRLTTLS